MATKAVVLLSGGLDSTLAALLLKEQGIEVHGIHFSTGFCLSEHKRTMSLFGTTHDEVRSEAARAQKNLGVPVKSVDLGEEYLETVLHPKHGYGANINPCIDCRIMMLRKAKAYADEIGAQFVATGEVTGQRPMSQRRDTMRVIEKESGLEGRLVRPLCAKRLPPTEPEKQGLLDRTLLLDFCGRGRRPQMELIARKGISDYPLPAGGCCFLTDRSYAARFRDLLSHSAGRKITRDDLVLLKTGRHFRLSQTLKLVAARDEGECRFLELFSEGRVRFEAVEASGPVALSDGPPPSKEEELLCARIVARFSAGKHRPEVEVEARGGDGEPRIYKAAPIWDETVLANLRILSE